MARAGWEEDDEGEAPDSTIPKIFLEGWERARRNFGRQVYFFAPSIKRYRTEEYENSGPPRFIPFSITGGQCSLLCDHCRGKVLEGMRHALSPADLLHQSASLVRQGVQGMLISGGSGIDGVVPLKSYLPTLEEIKKRYGLRLIVHLGLVDDEMAEGLAGAGVEAAMLDIIGSDETIRQVYHLDATVADYEASLGRLASHGINLSPHVVIGLHYGHIRGEREALQRISRFPISSLVLVGLLPLYDTPMEGLSPPSPEEMAQFFLESRALFPRTPILLGCERPGGEHKQQTDLYALLAGINGIAYPAEGTVRAARSLGLEPIFSPWCCSLL